MLKFPFNLQRFAASGSISISTLSQNISNNTSVIRVTYTVTRTSGTSYWSDAHTVAFNVDGQTLYSSITLPSSSRSNSCYVDVTVSHNSDGTKSVYASASCPVNGVNGTPFGASTTVTLNTIPRTTPCPNLSGDIESTYNIALNPASSSFNHSLHVTFGNITGYINASGNLQSSEYKFSNNNIPFTIPSSFYQQFSGKYGIGTMLLRTYNGSSVIGETSSSLTANCLESRCRPNIIGTVKDSNATTKALTGNENKLVKYFSNALLTLTLKASTTNGDTKSTITSRSVDGTSFSGTSVTLNKVSKKDFVITVTNSREFSTSVVLSASDLIEYFIPSIIVNPQRYPDQTSSQVRLTYSGSFFNQNFGTVANAITMKWYWKLSNASEWTLGGTITPTLSGNNINEAVINCGNDFNYQNAYRFKLEVIDKLTSEGTKEADVPRGEPIYSHGEDWFQHHTEVYNKEGYKFLDENKIKDILDENIKEIYSTNEIPIGTWVDEKTIYRKVIDTRTGNDTEYKELISNVDEIVNFNFYFVSDDTTKESYPNNIGSISSYRDPNGIIKFKINESSNWFKNKRVYFVLEYTKIID